MPDTSTKTILKVITTTAERIKELPIQNGQLIFVKDRGRIVFDQNDTRVFYNQIIEVESEIARALIEKPESGYYFVIDTACLWYYKDTWVQITSKPQDFVFIGTELPELGAENKSLYVNTDKKQISVFDSATQKYVVVADKTDVNIEINVDSVSQEEIRELFR